MSNPQSEKMLELVLTTHWFRMIESGVKLEEYRDLKPYWWKRIFTSAWSNQSHIGGYNGRFRRVRFRLGYKRDAETMIWELGHVGIGNAKPEWAMGHMGKMILLPLHKRIN